MKFWKLEFQKLNLRIGVLKENGVLEIRVLRIRLRNWSFENYLKIGILDNYLKIEVLEIKFENWKFGKLNFDIKIWRIKKGWNMVVGLHAKGGHAWPCRSGMGPMAKFCLGSTWLGTSLVANFFLLNV